MLYVQGRLHTDLLTLSTASLGRYRIRCAGLMLMMLLSSPVAIASNAVVSSMDSITLDQAVSIAQRHDPWLTGNRFKEDALRSQSVAADTLPDPMVSLSFANLPTDTFDLDQEPMTQVKVGVSQRFPRGDSRSLERERLMQLSDLYPYERLDRQAKVAVTVAHLWLDAFRAEESIRLIEQDRELFEKLVNVVQSNYASALGKTRQQDLIRAQLELTRLDDRITQLYSQKDIALSRLSQWLVVDSDSLSFPSFGISDSLPALVLFDTDFLLSPDQRGQAYLVRHPAILAIEKKINASRTSIKLAKQSYKPQWGVNASYGHRDDDLFGNERADFFSVGVSFDVPLFTGNRQDKQVQSAIATSESIRTDKTLLLRKLWAEMSSATVRLQRLDQRQQLYEERLLAEMYEQAEAALTAYTNDAGDFAEVVRARIAQLNARIDALHINIDRLKTIAQLNYFLIDGNSYDQTQELTEQ